MKIHRWIALGLTCGVLASGTLPFAHAQQPAAAVAAGDLENVIASKYEEDGYRAYRLSHASAQATHSVIQLEAQAFSREDSTGVRAADSAALGGKAVEFSAGARAEFPLEIEETGLYTVRLDYVYLDTQGLKNSDITLLFDGKAPFAESQRLTLPRIWTQEAVVHRDGANDFTPKSEQAEVAAVYTAADTTGMEGEFLYYLEKGAHVLALESAAGGFAVGRITVGSPALPDDDTYRAGTRYDYSGDIYTIETEEIYLKNDSSITSGVDRTDASVSPNDPVYKKVNVLNGSKFLKPLQSASWKIDVKKDGRYRIGIRFKQDTLQGAFVTRRLLLNGEPVCAGLSNLRFAYDDNWQYTVLQADGKDLCLDLSAGEHTLSLEVTLGDLRPYIQRMDEMVFALNYLYRKIIMVTGTSPDPLRDYNLADEIPYLVSDFQAIADELDDIYAQLGKLGVKGGQISILSQLSDQLRSFVRDPYHIQNRLANYKSNISALSSLIMTLQDQPLTIDYFSLIGDAQKNTEVKSGWLANLWFQIRSFIGSFYCDYTSIGGGGGSAQDGGRISVWFSGGREQAELLKDIIDEQFSAKHGVAVNLQLVSISLSQAILAGTAPDVMLTTSRSQPVNLGARGVLEDLSGYEGFDELRDVFGDTLLAPYTYRGKVFALPVTLDYHVMFYRQDILGELGLKLPQTWDDLYAMIPVIQRNNMAIGLPYTVLSSQATIESGIGAKDIFATLVLQRNTPLYNDARTSILLDSTAVIGAFEQWTDFYTKYQLDLEYSFYNRFRTGEMPIAIQSYANYNMLAAAAPEIRGLWGMTTVPGTRQADGSINRAEAASGSGAVMVRDCKDKPAAWSFIKWWVSAEAQSAYGNALEVLMGKASRYNPANPDAMKALPWEDEELAVLLEQRSFVREIPEVLGGYYTVRGLDNAFRNVVFSGRNYKEALTEQGIIINAELARKQQEFAGVVL